MCNENCDYDTSCCNCQSVENCLAGKLGNPAECHPEKMCSKEHIDKMRELSKKLNLEFPSKEHKRRPCGIAGLHN